MNPKLLSKKLTVRVHEEEFNALTKISMESGQPKSVLLRWGIVFFRSWIKSRKMNKDMLVTLEGNTFSAEDWEDQQILKLYQAFRENMRSFKSIY